MKPFFERARYYLLLAIIATAPMSFTPSLALPMFQFSSFRIGLPQLLGTLFIFLALPLLWHYWRTLLTHRLVLVGTLFLIVDLAVGVATTGSLSRTLLYSASLVFLLLLGFSAFVVSKQLSKTESRKLVPVLLWSGVVFGTLAVLQLVLASFDRTALGTLCTGCSDAVFGFPRINVFAAEPQFFANSLLPALFAGLLLRDNKRLANASLILSSIAIGLTFSRGALLAVGTGLLLVVVIKLVRKESAAQVVKLSMLAIVSIGISFGLLIASANIRYHDTPNIAFNTTVSMLDHLSFGKIHIAQRSVRSATASQEGSFTPEGFVVASSNDRLSAASLAINAWNDSAKTVFFGVGMGNLGTYVMNHIQAVPENLTVYIWYILSLSELGLVGLGVLILPILYALWRSYRNLPQTFAYFALATTAAFAVQLCTFGSYINIVYLPVYIGWFLGVSYLVAPLRRKDA